MITLFDLLYATDARQETHVFFADSGEVISGTAKDIFDSFDFPHVQLVNLVKRMSCSNDVFIVVVTGEMIR